MKTAHFIHPGYALLAGLLLLTPSTGAPGQSITTCIFTATC